MNSREYESRLQELKAEFLESAEAQVEELRTLFDRIGHMPRAALDPVVQIAHDLRGTGSVYGFESITEYAGRLEDAIEQGEDRGHCRTLLGQLEQAVQIASLTSFSLPSRGDDDSPALSAGDAAR